jgi:peptide/nickel transport system permease protein
LEQAQGQITTDLEARRGTSFRGALAFTRRWPIFSGIVLFLFAMMAIFAPLIVPHDPGFSILRERNTPPVWYEEGTWKYPLGKDPIGRDVLSRLIMGARTSLMVVAVSIVVGTIIGTGLGLIAGYFGGLIDEVIMRLVDIWYGIPFVMVALIVAITVGAGLYTMMGLLAAASFAGFVRQVRAEVLSIKERDYVALAIVAGASPPRILIMHILPGVLNTVVVIVTLSTGGLILAEAFLSFLGAGIPPPTPTWGAMVADGREYLRTAWWITVVPGIAILLIVLALNFLGDWLRDRLDPRLRQVL